MLDLVKTNAEIIKKDVKRINIKVYPDTSVKITVPYNYDDKQIDIIINKKIGWINKQKAKFSNQLRTLKREYVSGEDHYVNGKRYILEVIDSKTPKVETDGFKKLKMFIQKKSSIANKEKCLYLFYSDLLNKKINYYLPSIEKKIGVKCNEFKIRKMKNKWACCNAIKRIITFNVELAKKNDSEIQYVITHELIHLIEEKHNEHFYMLMNKYFPGWEKMNDSINNILKESKEY